MATVTRENIGLLNDKLTVTVNKNDYYIPFEKSLNKYSKSANIPGFRKGMVPAGLIKKMHGSSIMTEEILRAVEKELQEYLQNEKLEIFAQPLPLESDLTQISINNPIDYSFHFELGLKPDFDVENILKTVNLPSYTIEVTEAMIDEQVKQMQERFADNIDKETIDNEEYILNLKFEESDTEGNLLPNGIIEQYSLKPNDFNNDIHNQFIGKKKNDTIIIELQKHLDLSKRPGIAKKLGINIEDENAVPKYFKLTIENILLRQNATIDEGFFKKVYPDKEITTEIDFRNKIKEEIQNYWNDQSNKKIYDDLYHYLLDNTNITLPEGFLKRWLEKSNDKKKTIEEVEEAFPTFAKQLKWTLISDKLVHLNNIQVSPEEIREHIAKQVIAYYTSLGIPIQADNTWLSDYINKLLKDEQHVESAYRQLLDNKLFETIGKQINTTKKTIPQQDFEKMISEHKH